MAALMALMSIGLWTSAARRAHGAEDEPYIGPAGGAAVEAREAAAATGALKLSLRGAIVTSLLHNRGLRVEILQPAVMRTFEAKERAAFDPVIGGTGSISNTRDRAATRRTTSAFTGGMTGELYIEEFLPSGTTVRAGASTSTERSSLYKENFAETRAGVTVTQALLRGMSIGANLAQLHQARLDTRISEYELRGFAESLVAEVERTYWEYALQLRTVAIVEQAKKVAERQLYETRERVRVGRISRAELAAAEAEVALRNEDLIDAESELEQTRLRLMRLIGPPGGEEAWRRDIALTDELALPEDKPASPEDHVEIGLRMRPDLNEARLSVQRGDLEVVHTKNGLLPKLDFFLTLGATGYSETFKGSAGKVNGHHYDVEAGLTLEYPLLNRDARAAHRRAILSRRQLARAVENLAQLVQLDVRTACVKVRRARSLAMAAGKTRSLREQSLRAETEKFKVGKSSSFLVARAQRDLLDSRLKEIRAISACLTALTDLYRLEGSLLQRRGLAAPGEEPVPGGP